MTTARKKITSKTKSWVFKKAWSVVKKNFRSAKGASFKAAFAWNLRKFWKQARDAAGIVGAVVKNVVPMTVDQARDALFLLDQKTRWSASDKSNRTGLTHILLKG